MTNKNVFKVIFCLALFMLVSGGLFAQTWTVTSNGINFRETLISKEQFDALLYTYSIAGSYAEIYFVNAARMRSDVRGKVRPRFTGYYYILSEVIPKDDNEKMMYIVGGYGTVLMYGHINTGEMIMQFYNAAGADIAINVHGYNVHKLGSIEYNRIYNQNIRLVNGQ